MSEIWNGVASGWEANAAYVDEQLASATKAMLDAARIDEGDAVLDLACGPGGAGLAAAERVGGSGKVLLSDSAPEMVAAAGRRASGRAQVSTAIFNQSEIACADEEFDAVLVRHGLMFVEDPVAAVAESTRVLRPGGSYAVMTWGPRAENPWLGLVLDAVGEQFGVQFPPAGVLGPFSLDDAAQLTSVMEAGGLEDVAVQVVATPMYAPSVQAWWERVPQLAGPLAIALNGMEPEVREAIAQRALDAGASAARPAGDQIAFAGSVLVASGRRPRSRAPVDAAALAS